MILRKAQPWPYHSPDENPEVTLRCTTTALQWGCLLPSGWSPNSCAGLMRPWWSGPPGSPASSGPGPLPRRAACGDGTLPAPLLSAPLAQCLALSASLSPPSYLAWSSDISSPGDLPDTLSPKTWGRVPLPDPSLDWQLLIGTEPS